MLDDVSSVCESVSNEVEEPAIIEPSFKGYQLIGDSQLLRFSGSLLNLKRKEKDGFSLLGLCVSGQRISHLLDRVRTNFGDVSEKVVLMIGTNDLLGGTSFEKMRDDLKELLELLSQSAKNIILLTLPPVPKLEKSRYHWDRLKKYNELIQKFHDGERFFIGNAYAEFVYPKESQKTSSSTSSSDSGNCSESLRSNDEPENDSKCTENEDDVSLFPPLSKRPRQSPLSLPNNKDDSTQEVLGQLYPPNLKKNSKGSTPPVSTAHSPNNAPMLASVDTVTPSDSALMYSGSATILSSDGVADDVASSPFSGASLFSGNATSLSGDAISPSGNVTSPFGNVSLLSDDPSFSGDMMTPLGNALTTFDNITASGDAINLDATPTPGSAVLPSADTTSHSNGAATLSGIKATPSGDTMKPSCDTASLFGTSAVLPVNIEMPSPAVSLPGSAFSPAYDAKSDFGGAVSPLGDPPSHSKSTTTPTNEAKSLSGGAMTPFGDVVSPSGDGTSHSGGALTPSDCATPSSFGSVITPSSGSVITPSSGTNDSFTTPSRKKLPFKRKRNCYSKGNNRYYGRTDEIEIENADKIRDEYFEKYYDISCRRPDLIHLNTEGLRVIERIIQDVIDTLDMKKSQD